jgi:hypothetical protein
MVLIRKTKKSCLEFIRQSPCYTQEMIQLGFQFVTVNSDIRLFVAEVPEVLESMGRAGLRQQKPC